MSHGNRQQSWETLNIRDINTPLITEQDIVSARACVIRLAPDDHDNLLEIFGMHPERPASVPLDVQDVEEPDVRQ